MNRSLSPVMICLASLMLLFSAPVTVQAASTVTHGTPTLTECNLTTFRIAANIQGTVEAGDTFYFNVEVNGTTVLDRHNIGTGPTNVVYPSTGGWANPLGTTYPYVGQFFWYFNNGLLEGDYLVATVTCTAEDTATITMNYVTPSATPPAPTSGNSSPRPAFLDGRINNYDAGSPVVLYGIDYGNNQRGLHVYNGRSGSLVFEITAEQIQAVAACPAENTLIAADAVSGIMLHRLAPDENGVCNFQLNAPTEEAGKFYIIIFKDLYANSSYRSWEEFIGR